MIRILKNLSTVYDGEFDEIVFVAKPEAFKMKEDLFVDLKKSVPKIQFHEGTINIVMSNLTFKAFYLFLFRDA